MAKTVLFPTNRTPKRVDALKDFTIRDFSGGWNRVDSELNLSSKFSRIERNTQRGIDGSKEIRPGTRLFSDVVAHISDIVNMEYFAGALVAVGSNGKIVRVDAAGNVYLIWDDEWAYRLSGNPTGWGATSFCSFAEFQNKLIICNGVNKPLRVRNTHLVEYLNDPASGSNVNTPIGRYVINGGRYLVIAGSASNIDRIHISSTDTDGVFVNDGAPNDAVNIDLGSRVPLGSSAIKGLGRFRDKIVVAFEKCLLPGTLGVFTTDGDHNPTFDDAIINNGSISHRVIQTVGNGEDMLFADTVGVNSIKRALFTGSIQPERLSRLVDPEIQKDVSRLEEVVTLEDDTFSIFDNKANNYMLFIPNHDDALRTETRCFTLKKVPEMKIEAWHEWLGWNWQAACRSALERIFFAKGSQIFVLGETHEGGDSISADFVGDQEVWSDGFPWIDGTGWNPVADVNDSGVPIRWVWELPWSDADQRFRNKESRFIRFDTEGDETFTASMFVDKFYFDLHDHGQEFLDETFWDDSRGWDEIVLAPALSMVFRGGDSPGFGEDGYGELYGGGRPTREEGLYGWNAKYHLFKLRMSGEAMGPLKFVSVSLAYLLGSVRR